jgi:predicted GTPase
MINTRGNTVTAMGYSDKQMKDETTITKYRVMVIIGTPIDLRRVIKINKPAVRIDYGLRKLADLI